MTTTERAQVDVPAMVDDLIATLVERIAEAVEPIQIWLFGSRARGDDDEWSDVDLLVVLDHAADRRACRAELSRLLTDIPIGTDILFATAEQIVRRGRVAGTVLNNALEEGKLIYEQEDPHAATALEWLRIAEGDLEIAEPAMARLDQRARLGKSDELARAAGAGEVHEGGALPGADQSALGRTSCRIWRSCCRMNCANGRQEWNSGA